jgi:hypothetical protein
MMFHSSSQRSKIFRRNTSARLFTRAVEPIDGAEGLIEHRVNEILLVERVEPPNVGHAAGILLAGNVWADRALDSFVERLVQKVADVLVGNLADVDVVLEEAAVVGRLAGLGAGLLDRLGLRSGGGQGGEGGDGEEVGELHFLILIGTCGYGLFSCVR